MTPIHRLLCLFLATLVLASCVQAPRIQGKTPEEIDASLALLAARPSVRDPKAMQHAVSRLRQVAALSAEDRGLLPNPYDAISGMTADDFVRFMAKYDPSPAQVESQIQTDFPNGVLATNMLKLYQLQQGMLQDAREGALLAGRSVIDQFPIPDLQFIPPVSGSGIDSDRAVFRVSLLNNTRFDVYRPSFRVTVKDGEGEVLYERLFEQPHSAKEPIGPGETKAIDLVCCQLLSDAYNNAMMRSLPARATISASLVNVEDHSGRAVLETVAFTEEDNRRLHFLEACIDHLTPRLESWVPPEDGSECLSERALAEWETAKRTADAQAPRTASLN